jgi:hypothetical protein
MLEVLTEDLNCAFPNSWFAGMNSLVTQIVLEDLNCGFNFNNLRMARILALPVHTLLVQWI